jgi:predicted DCC family thiol-disulfide oxidoreductase YuxK
MTTASVNDGRWLRRAMNSGSSPMKANVLYDGDCPLCRKSVSILRKLDWFGRLGYVNARDGEQPILREPPVAEAPLLEEMHLLTAGGKLYRGFAAFRWMAWRLPVFWLAAPFLYFPGVPWVGQRLYRWVARNRFHLVPCHDGVCEIKQHRPV